jgi:hypothetical protein
VSPILLLLVLVVAYWIYNNVGKRDFSLKSRRNDPTVIDVEATIVDEVSHCPKCDSKIKEDFKICPYCGCILKPKCQLCGRELNREWKKCPYCEPK